MIIIKYTSLFLLFIAISLVGVVISEKYKKRVIELKEMKKALNILETKMKFTYEPIPEIFLDIQENMNSNVKYIFKQARENMKENAAGKAWDDALKNKTTSLNPEDITILQGLTSLLGKTNLEGQINQINLTSNFLDNQIKQAEESETKNRKMYKTLGVVIGLACVIILI